MMRNDQIHSMNRIFYFLLFNVLCYIGPIYSMSLSELHTSIKGHKARIKEIKLNIERLKLIIEVREARRLECANGYPSNRLKLFYKNKYEDDTWHEWKKEPKGPNPEDIARELACERYHEYQKMLMTYLNCSKEERREDPFLKIYIESSFPACPYFLSEDEYYEEVVREALYDKGW